MVTDNTDSKRYNLSPLVLKDLSKEIDAAANIMPEVNFVGFSMYTLLLAEVCRQFSTILPQSSDSTGLWEKIDAACAIFVGIGQIMNPKSEPIANRLKGVSNILAGGELYWLTIIGLGPIGFAADVGLAFTHSLYDMAKTLRRINDLEYWYNDTKRELDFLASERSTLLINLQQLKENRKVEHDWKKKKVLSWLIDRRINHLYEVESMINSLQNVLSEDGFNSARVISLQKELLEHSYNTLMLGAAFIGLILLNTVGMNLPVVVFITVAVVLYTYKYAPRVGAFFTDVTNYLNTDSHYDVEDNALDNDDLIDSQVKNISNC